MSEPAAGVSPTGRSAGTEERPDLLGEVLPYRIVRPYRVRFEEATVAETMRTAIYLAWRPTSRGSIRPSSVSGATGTRRAGSSGWSVR